MADEDSNLALSESELPLVLPSTVGRTLEGGLPTKHLIDWEQRTRNWYKVNTVALDTKLTEVKSSTDDAHARITVETNARTGADFALAEQITTVEASVGAVSANGQIYFGAAATPAGAVAAYGLYLTAGNAFTGMEAIARTDGTSAMGFTAAQFVFTDSGTMQPVFTYSGGHFLLTGNVQIDGNLVVSGTVNADKIQANEITRTATGQSAATGSPATAVIDAKVNDKIQVTVTYSGATQLVGGSPGVGTGTIRLNNNAGTQQTLRVPMIVVSTSEASGGTYTMEVATVTRQFVFTAPSTGTHTISASGMVHADIFITALATSR